MPSRNNWVSKVRDILERIHPGEWDSDISEEFILSDDPHMKCRFYIHYPKIVVKNAKGDEHTVYDMFIRLTMLNSGKLYGVDGTRTTLSTDEARAGYVHSHLSTTASDGNFGGFCYGSGPITKDIGDLGRGFDEMRFEAFIHGIQVYLEWESLEGNPYVKMSSVTGRRDIDSLAGNPALGDHYRRFIHKFDSVEFNILNNKSIKVSHENIHFISAVKQITRSSYLVYRDDDGKYFKIVNTRGESRSPTSLGFKFKGKDMVQKFIEIEHEEKLRETFPHPDITRYIAGELTRELTLHAFATRGKFRRKPEGILIGGAMVQDI